MELNTVYFKNPGGENTEEVLSIARKRAEELGIKTMVIASTSGNTAVRAMDVFQGLRVVVVTHVTGMREPDSQEFTDENRKKVESKGGKIVTAAHAFSGVNRAIRNKYNMPTLGDIIADTLRIFGKGLKVACEITMMAADSGLVCTGEDAIAIGGTGNGSDTAVVLRPANSHNFFDLKIKEILCRPHL